MDLNQSQPPSLHLAPYPSISVFSTLLSGSPSTTPLSARVLLELCRNVARDLAYVTRLREDIQLSLDVGPAYHAEWIDEVRRAASQALYLVNQHIESKVPVTQAQHLLKGNANDLHSKIASVISPSKKDTECISSLRADLSAAHMSLMGAAGFMQQIALREGDQTPDRTQLQIFRNLSSGSEGQATSRNAAGVITSETSTLV